jgi:FAD/FMN-containing dehydrogenase
VTTTPSRREVLATAGAGLLAAGLAACTGRSGGTPNSGGSSTRPSSPSPSSGHPSSGSSPPTLASLAGQVSGGVALPGQPGYSASTLLYNPRFTPSPQAIAGCRTAADVAACVRFAAAGGAALRLRNGGHSYGGWSSGPGLVADLAQLKTITVDTSAMTATVGAGALLADVYAQLAASGVSIGAGSCATVGVTGLTLGGGQGVLTRAYGLSCDQLTSIDVVTADGAQRTVDAGTDPDLFWALRGGGGGSFGAVTALTFSVRPAPTITTFFLQWAWADAALVLGAWQQWISTAPRELWSTGKLLADPGSGLIVTVSGTWIGSGPVSAPLQSLLAAVPKPSVSSYHTGSYGATMLGEAGCSGQDAAGCLVAAYTPAKRQPFAATSSVLQQALPSAGISAIVAAVAAGMTVPGLVEGGASFDALGGAVADVGAAETAFPWRGALAIVQHTATWNSASAGADPAPYDSFVAAERQALAPWLGSSAYVNYADASITDFGPAYWGPNLARLKQVKQTYDPGNVFSFPQSITV